MYTGIIGSVSGLSTSDILRGPGDPARVDQALAGVPVTLSTAHSPWSTTIWRIFLLPLRHSWWLGSCLPQSLPADWKLYWTLSLASRYLNHLKFKQWARAAYLASLSQTLSMGLTMSRQMGHLLNVFRAQLSDICIEILNQMTPCCLNKVATAETTENYHPTLCSTQI